MNQRRLLTLSFLLSILLGPSCRHFQVEKEEQWTVIGLENKEGPVEPLTKWASQRPEVTKAEVKGEAKKYLLLQLTPELAPIQTLKLISQAPWKGTIPFHVRSIRTNEEGGSVSELQAQEKVEFDQSHSYDLPNIFDVFTRIY